MNNLKKQILKMKRIKLSMRDNDPTNKSVCFIALHGAKEHLESIRNRFHCFRNNEITEDSWDSNPQSEFKKFDFVVNETNYPIFMSSAFGQDISFEDFRSKIQCNSKNKLNSRD